MTNLAPYLEKIPQLGNLASQDKAELIANAQVVNVPAACKVFNPGDACNAFLIVVEGSVRVQMIGDSGREIVLYRVENGQTCILTTSCLLSDEVYNAEALTEEETTAIAIPANTFQKLLANSQGFRDIVFASYGQRISSLVMLVEEVAFKRIDKRLAQFLLKMRNETGVLSKTHYELAVELGSAREVISRQLKEFERKGWIALARGIVKIVDEKAMNAFIQNQCD